MLFPIVSNYNATSAFDLADLFSGGQDGLRWDIQDLGTLWQDTAATTAAGVGDPVGRVDDVSGNGRNGTFSASKPTLRQDGGGKYYLEFADSTDDRLDFTAMTTIRSILWAVDDDGTTAYTPILGDSSYYDFHGGNSSTLLSSVYAASVVKNGTWRLNQSSITATSEPRPSPMGILTCVTTGNARASNFSHDRSESGDRDWDGKLYQLIISDEAWSGTTTADAEQAVSDLVGGPF